jgi:hypothetical protein
VICRKVKLVDSEGQRDREAKVLSGIHQVDAVENEGISC